MDAPEKLYVDIEDRLSDSILYGFIEKRKDDDVEYIRKDAFIKKALKWYCLDCECNDNCKDTKCFFHNEYKRFLEGKENACPPKFEYTILNPDGSTSDNWRHRHFIRKMQDAFIEKACEYWYKYNHDVVINKQSHEFTVNVEGFKNYMKGK